MLERKLIFPSFCKISSYLELLKAWHFSKRNHKIKYMPSQSQKAFALVDKNIAMLLNKMFHSQTGVFLWKIPMFLREIPMFLPKIPMFLREIAMSLCEIAMSLCETVMSMCEIAMFLREMSCFLCEIAKDPCFHSWMLWPLAAHWLNSQISSKNCQIYSKLVKFSAENRKI